MDIETKPTRHRKIMNENSLAMGISIGIALGAGIGVAIQNIAVGIGCGLALGVAIGSLWNKKEERSNGRRERRFLRIFRSHR